MYVYIYIHIYIDSFWVGVIIRDPTTWGSILQSTYTWRFRVLACTYNPLLSPLSTLRGLSLVYGNSCLWVIKYHEPPSGDSFLFL